MCTLCDEGKPQDHEKPTSGSRREFLKASTATGVAAAGVGLLNPTPALADGNEDDEPRDSGRPGRRYIIRNGYVMSMDPSVGDFVNADVLIEGKKIVAVGPICAPAARRTSTRAGGS